MNEYLFHSLRLLDPVKGRTEAGQMVLVRGDRFASAGRNLRAGRNVRKIDLGGRVLMPGLIDCHIHIMSIKTKWANNTLMHMLPSPCPRGGGDQGA
jgi:imidazolonepropionase-like amidohydrolase